MRKTKTFALIAVAAAAALLTPTRIASAQPAAAKKDAAAPQPPAVKPLAETLTGDAKAAYDAGRVLFGDGDFAGAGQRMQRAFDLSKDPRLLWNIAACEKKMRHYAKVVPLVTQYLNDAASMITPEQTAEAQEVLKTIKGFVAKLSVKVDQPDATVSVDDAEIGKAPTTEPLLIEQGKHTIKVAREGFKPWTDTREIVGETDLVLDVHLLKEVHEGRLIIIAGEKDQIAVDGSVRGLGQWNETIGSGAHSLHITAPGMKAHDEDVIVQDGATRTVRVTLEADGSSGSKTWLWLTIGGGVALATGIVVTAVVLGGKSETTAAAKPGSLGVIELGAPSLMRW